MLSDIVVSEWFKFWLDASLFLALLAVMFKLAKELSPDEEDRA